MKIKKTTLQSNARALVGTRGGTVADATSAKCSVKDQINLTFGLRALLHRTLGSRQIPTKAPTGVRALVGTRGGTRTHKEQAPHDFESCVYTNSTTLAWL